jgi:hypothetical protein
LQKAAAEDPVELFFAFCIDLLRTRRSVACIFCFCAPDMNLLTHAGMGISTIITLTPTSADHPKMEYRNLER